MKKLMILLLSVLLVIGFSITAVIYYIKSPITVTSSNVMNNYYYRIMCCSEWNKKVLSIPVYIKPFDLQKPDIIFNVLNKRTINNESLRICPSIIKLDSLIDHYNTLNIEIYLKNVVNIDEVPPDYIYKITKNNIATCDSILFLHNCYNLERIR